MKKNFVGKDFLGTELNIGDSVVFMNLNYRNFEVGVITTMAEKSCTIEQKITETYTNKCRQTYDQLIKHPHFR